LHPHPTAAPHLSLHDPLPIFPLVVPRRRPQEGPPVIVEGFDDMLVRLAKCCDPVPGDPIEGFVTVGRGVSVHRSDCTNIDALREKHERMVDVTWAAGQMSSYSVWIQVE